VTDMVRTLLAAGIGAVAALLLARACASPPEPVVDAVELQQIAEERAALAADVAREHGLIEERARELARLELYERIEVLAAHAPTGTRRAPALHASADIPAPEVSRESGSDGRCVPAGAGIALCPEPVLERLTLRLIAAESDRDSARLDLDAERAYRRMDAEVWAVEREGYARALDAAKPPAPWRLPAAVVSGAAIATGIALAASGRESVGMVVAGVGAVGAVVAAW
jgi:hypothetical protein